MTPDRVQKAMLQAGSLVATQAPAAKRRKNATHDASRGPEVEMENKAPERGGRNATTTQRLACFLAENNRLAESSGLLE